jgi:hypothetical protein
MTPFLHTFLESVTNIFQLLAPRNKRAGARKSIRISQPVARSPKPTGERTTFFSLPRELRQKIIIDAFPSLPALFQTITAMPKPRMDLQHLHADHRISRAWDIFEVETWAIKKGMMQYDNFLQSLHPVIKDDMGFVGKKWMVRYLAYEDELREEVKEWAKEINGGEWEV